MEKKKEPLRCRSVAEDDSMSWREVAGLNEIIDVGCYVVQLKHGAGNDELPLPPCDQEHYIVATLIVTESGSEKLQKHRVIGQTLILSQCDDGQTGIYYRSLAPVNGNFVWSEWNALLSTGQFNEIADGNTSITLDVKDNSVTAQKLSADVRKKVDSPLRPLYIAAGAEYNDSAVDMTKTAPWGEIVTHKVGHYYLNGIGDITEDQMIEIYYMRETLPLIRASSTAERWFQNDAPGCRTFFPIKKCGRRIEFSFIKNGYYTFKQCPAEVLKWTFDSEFNYYAASLSGECEGIFSEMQNLRFLDNLNVGSATLRPESFQKCYKLEFFRITNLKSNVTFHDSPLLNKECVVHMITKAAPLSAITITLHADAYTRLADDAEIIAALEAQPLVSLVSA